VVAARYETGGIGSECPDADAVFYLSAVQVFSLLWVLNVQKGSPVAECFRRYFILAACGGERKEILGTPQTPAGG